MIKFKRFTNEEIIKARTDDEIMRQIIENFMPLVHKMATKYMCRNISNWEKDDLLSVGMYKIYEAVETFDPEMEIKFFTHVYNKVKFGVGNCARSSIWGERCTEKALSKRKLQDRYASLNRQVDDDGKEYMDLVVGSYNENFTKNIDADEFWEVVKANTTQKQFYIIEQKYKYDRKNIEIARELGITGQTVSDQEKSTLKKLKRVEYFWQ